MEKQVAKITHEDLDTLAKAGVIPAGTPPAILQVFAATSQQHGLSPFKKEIYLVKYGSQYSVIVGIDGLRAKASRTGCFAGREDVKFDIQPDGTFKTAAQLKASNARPTTATVTVYKMISGQRCPFTKTVVFAEYCPANPANKWASMPLNMIEKCAEAAALRMGFADETAGLHIEEEKAAFEDSTLAAAEKRPEISVDIEQLRQLIEDCEGVEALNKLYRSSPLYAAHAQLFTERKEAILETLQTAGK